MITLEKIMKILKDDYGINSVEEFIEVYKDYPGIDIGIFTTPLEGTRYEKENGIVRNRSGVTAAGASG